MFRGYWGCCFGCVFPLLYPSFLTGLELLTRILLEESQILRICTLWERKSRAINVSFYVMVADFIFKTVAANMVCYIRPGSQAIDFSPFEEEKLFVCTPVFGINGDRVLLNNRESVGLGFMIAGC